MAETAAGSTTTGLAGPTKEQIMAKIQELIEQLNKANKQIALKIKIKEPNIYNREQAKLENFLQELDIYFTARKGMDNTGKILFAAFYFRETAAS
jgi:predicted XRE-type DNA-binding protein